MAAISPDTIMEPKLNFERHKTYWLRCLRTYLPYQYTSSDSNRLMLAYFTLAALDLLGCLHNVIKPEEKEGYVQWLYRCQHPNGGFRGSPSMDFGHRSTVENAKWDSASVPSTYFALASLCILGDDLSKVERKECLTWLRKMQRSDGSFGEALGEDGRIEGGTDPRFGYCATGIRWLLRGTVGGEVDGVPDIKVDAFVNCIRLCQTYDGGLSEGPFREAQAGFTYCSIASLHLLSRLPVANTHTSPSSSAPSLGLTNIPLTLHWLLSRQTVALQAEDEDDTPESITENDDQENNSNAQHDSIYGDQFQPVEQQWVGFNGRCNKLADTCYEFWVLGSVTILGKAELCNIPSNRRYLLDKTQHPIGGFGKLPGDPPDVYHSYLGLAALSLLKEEGLKPLNPALCFSEDAKSHLESLPWRKAFV